MKSDLYGILQQAFGAELEGNVIDTLISAATIRDYSANNVICRQGDVGDTLFVIMAGEVVVTQSRDNEPLVTLDYLSAGRYFGEISLIDESPRMATCTAVTDATIMEITEKVFDNMVEQSPALAVVILKSVLNSMRSQDALAIAGLQAKNVELSTAYADLHAAQAEIIIKERLEHELELAADVQQRLLPASLPQYSDYRFAAYLKPARFVGGDFYDVLHLDAEHVGLLIADVADKGVHASLFMAVSRTLFFSEAQKSLSPAAVLHAVHTGMLNLAPNLDMFVTAFYAVLHRPSGLLTYVRAAHERPLLLKPGAEIVELPGDGRFLGMIPELTLTEHSITLQAGDRLILFSDGLPDAMDQAQGRYGYERLKTVLRKNDQLETVDLCNQLVVDLMAWVQDAPPFDDLTLLTMDVLD